MIREIVFYKDHFEDFFEILTDKGNLLVLFNGFQKKTQKHRQKN